MLKENLRLLGFSKIPCIKELRKKVTGLLLEIHPDMNMGNSSDSEETSKKVIKAYNELKGFCVNNKANSDTSQHVTGKLIFCQGDKRYAIDIGIVREVISGFDEGKKEEEAISHFIHKGRFISLLSIEGLASTNISEFTGAIDNSIDIFPGVRNAIIVIEGMGYEVGVKADRIFKLVG